MFTEPTVFVVDDDPGVCESLTELIESMGLKVESFPDAQRFLQHYTPNHPGCLIVDVRLPGMSGLKLQETVAEQGICLPVIVITGHGDVTMAVRAMKTGALDFIEKPYKAQTLLERVREALARDARARRQQVQCDAIAARITLLTSGEYEVLERVVAGQPNKVIAAELGLSIPAIEARRKKVMEKLRAESLADLVRMLFSYKARQGKS